MNIMRKRESYGNKEQKNITKWHLHEEIQELLQHNSNMMITVIIQQPSLSKTSNTQLYIAVTM